MTKPVRWIVRRITGRKWIRNALGLLTVTGVPCHADPVGPPRRRRLFQGPVDRLVIRTGDCQGQPPFQFPARVNVAAHSRVVGAPLLGSRGRRPGEFENHPHRRTDESLNDPAEMGLAQWPVVSRDAILLAAPAQRLAVELRGVVHMNRTGLACHGPTVTRSRAVPARASCP